MFVGRKKELPLLEQCFQKETNEAVLVYGRKGIGKTELIRQFVKGKQTVYYLAREYSEEEQKLAMKREFGLPKELNDESFRAIYLAASMEKTEKFVIVVDEFDLLCKSAPSFLEEMQVLLNKPNLKGRLMVVCLSSSIQWVENEMTDVLSFDEKIKLKELTFFEVTSFFPRMSIENCVAIHGVLGGIPAYLSYWDEDKSLEENIEHLILEPQAPMREEATRHLKSYLRSLNFYNTILCVLAEDDMKLNYLYQRTGFSRAKISVYIKNLMEMDVTRKVLSYEKADKANLKKGLYTIMDPFLHFWYKFVYPNLSDLERLTPRGFYEAHIKNEIQSYIEAAYVQVCGEYLQFLDMEGRLPIHISTISSWYGKQGNIPIISEDNEGKILVGLCKWDQDPMQESEFENLLELMAFTGKEADYYYLFSKEGFTHGMTMMAKGISSIECIDLDNF